MLARRRIRFGRRRAARVIIVITLAMLGPSQAMGQGCLPPPRPFVPQDMAAAREYANLIRKDFETYLAEIGTYFRCLDVERARAFAEAEEVAEEYGRFIDATRN